MDTTSYICLPDFPCFSKLLSSDTLTWGKVYSVSVSDWAPSSDTLAWGKVYSVSVSHCAAPSSDTLAWGKVYSVNVSHWAPSSDTLA